MRPDTRNQDLPTLRHWILTPIVMGALLFGAPALAELAAAVVR